MEGEIIILERDPPEEGEKYIIASPEAAWEVLQSIPHNSALGGVEKVLPLHASPGTKLEKHAQ
ncbi:MAG: hypothetical protein ACMUIA_02835 [bacterium]